MMVVRTYLAASKINGIGIFAQEPIPAKTLMWQFTPGFDIEIDPELFPDLVKEYVRHHGSQFLPGTYLLCGDDARFMNHSDDPNMSGAGDENHALRDIRAGEEITCNYREFDVGFKGF